MKILKIIYVLLAINLFIFLRFLFPPYLFSDFESYYNIVLDSKYSTDGGIYEVLSYGTIKIVSYLVGDVDETISWLFLVNLFIFASCTLFISTNAKVSIGGILLFLSMFSPLLVFVTLRATPAYLLIACSIILAAGNRRLISIIIAMIAVMYHVTAVIPLFVIIVINFKIEIVKNKLNIIFVLILLLFVFHLLSLLIGIDVGLNKLGELIAPIDYIGKYSVYFDSQKTFGASHYLYYSYILFIFLLMRRHSESLNQEFVMYFYVMMLIYSAMMFSPVTAFRISIYFMIPLYLVVPWDNVFRFCRYQIYILLFPIIFLLSFYGIMIK